MTLFTTNILVTHMKQYFALYLSYYWIFEYVVSMLMCFCSRKRSGLGWEKIFIIRANKRSNRVMTRKISFTGSCCWKIEGKNKKGQKKKHPNSLGRNFNQKPPIAYITKFTTEKCQP